MAVMDEFREERENIKNQSLKKRIAYFWTYNKWFVIIGILLLVVVISTVYGFLTRTDSALYGVVVNSLTVGDADALSQDFAEYAQLDTKEYSVDFNASLQISNDLDETTINSSQFIMVYMAAQDLDLAVMDPVNFEKFVYNDIYADLRNCLSEEQLAALSGRIFYMDKALLAHIEELTDAQESTAGVELPDPFAPEEMEDPVPIGIDISGCGKLMDVYYYEDGTAYLGIIANSPHVDMAVTFIEYLFEE